jgi:hypothetical protein
MPNQIHVVRFGPRGEAIDVDDAEIFVNSVQATHMRTQLFAHPDIGERMADQRYRLRARYQRVIPHYRR